MNNLKNIKTHFYISLGIFVVSLVCPVLYESFTTEIVGFQCLIFGWIAIFNWIIEGKSFQISFSSISWFANFFIIAAWYFRYRAKYMKVVISSGIASLLSLLIIIESLTRDNFYKLGIGYVLWVFSFLYFFVATIILNYNVKKDENKLADVG